jgi:hypothetical protein
MRSFTRVRSAARKLRSAINPPPQRRLRRPAVLLYDRVTKYSMVIPDDLYGCLLQILQIEFIGPNATRGCAA